MEENQGSDKKYPLFMTRLMVEHPFFDPAWGHYQHPFKDEWTVGAIGHELNELTEEELDERAEYNDFLQSYDLLTKEALKKDKQKQGKSSQEDRGNER